MWPGFSVTLPSNWRADTPAGHAGRERVACDLCGELHSGEKRKRAGKLISVIPLFCRPILASRGITSKNAAV